MRAVPEESGIEVIDSPIKFEECEDSSDPLQEVEPVYLGGSRPGQLRRVVPRVFFEYKGDEFMTALCLRDGKPKIFDIDMIASVRVVGTAFDEQDDFCQFVESNETMESQIATISTSTSSNSSVAASEVFEIAAELLHAILAVAMRGMVFFLQRPIRNNRCPRRGIRVYDSLSVMGVMLVFVLSMTNVACGFFGMMVISGFRLKQRIILGRERRSHRKLVGRLGLKSAGRPSHHLFAGKFAGERGCDHAQYEICSG